MNLASYHAIPEQVKAVYLRTLPSIRERCERVHALAREGKLEYFEYHPEKEEDVASFCIGIMKVFLELCCKPSSSSYSLCSVTLGRILPRCVVGCEGSDG